jgi:GTP pyrophosphokinase
MGAILHALKKELPGPETDIIPNIEVPHKQTSSSSHDDIHIEGIGHLLTHIANCCKPVPGDAIIGYVTQSQGVNIHRKDCNNILENSTLKHERIINVSWGEKTNERYTLDLIIEAYDRHGLVRDITQLFTTEHVALLGLNCTLNKKERTAYVHAAIQVPHLELLSRLVGKIQQIPDVLSVKRNS